MIERRIRAAFRRFRLSSLAFISVLGLASVFSVNLAGFLVLLPRPLWGLLDAGFVASYFLRVSILLALAILASRYSAFIVSQVLRLVYAPLAVAWIFTKKAGRRLVQIKGYKAANMFADSLLRRHEVDVAKGYENSILGEMSKKVRSSNKARHTFGLIYILAYTRGRVDGRVEYFTIPIQVMVIVMVLSALFTTITGSIVLVALGVFLVFAIPPTPFEVYFEGAYLEKGESFHNFLNSAPQKVVKPQKLILMVLTISFASGMLHHKSLVSENGLLRIVGDVTSTGTLVVATNSGFIIHSSGQGYRYVPNGGTWMEVLPTTSETSD